MWESATPFELGAQTGQKRFPKRTHQRPTNHHLLLIESGQQPCTCPANHGAGTLSVYSGGDGDRSVGLHFHTTNRCIRLKTSNRTTHTAQPVGVHTQVPETSRLAVDSIEEVTSGDDHSPIHLVAEIQPDHSGRQRWRLNTGLWRGRVISACCAHSIGPIGACSVVGRKSEPTTDRLQPDIETTRCSHDTTNGFVPPAPQAKWPELTGKRVDWTRCGDSANNRSLIHRSGSHDSFHQCAECAHGLTPRGDDAVANDSVSGRRHHASDDVSFAEVDRERGRCGVCLGHGVSRG